MLDSIELRAIDRGRQRSGPAVGGVRRSPRQRRRAQLADGRSGSRRRRTPGLFLRALRRGDV